MYINIEIKTNSAETLDRVSRALASEPTKHSTVSCGYNYLNIMYDCSKNELSKIKKHWRESVPECLIVSV